MFAGAACVSARACVRISVCVRFDKGSIRHG